MLENSDKMILINITNPFDPSQREVTYLKPSESSTVASFVPAMLNSCAVSLNGKIIEKENRATTLTKAGDVMVVVPVPRGGDGGKDILRIVAMIALAVVAPYAAAGMAGAGAAAGTVALYQTGIMMVGSMLINSILPPSLPSAKNYNQSQEESPSYGVDGAKNTSTEDTVVPLVYGRYRIAGNRIAAFVKNVGNTQDAYLLYNAGEGPIAGISSLELNDQPAENFRDLEYQQRTGSATQSPMGWFNDNIIPKTKGVTLTEAYTLHTTSTEVDKFRFDVVAPAGLAYYNDVGGVDAVTVGLTIQYRLAGDEDWIGLEDTNKRISSVTKYYYNDVEMLEGALRAGHTLTGFDSKIILDESETIVGSVQQEHVYSTSHSIRGSGRQTVRRSYESPELPEGIYELRIRRNTPESTDSQLVDGLQLVEIDEIITDLVAYRHTALLGLRVRLSDQLTSLPNVTFLHHGKLIRVRRVVDNAEVWTYEASSNPAWVAYDILTNTRYGGAIAPPRINVAKWQDWADYCDEAGLEFNGVFDTQNNVWDSLSHVFRVGHAQIINQGTRYSIAIERADSPVMMFNSSSIIEKSMKINWLPKAERANEVELTFWNREDSYKRSMIKVRDTDVGPNDVVRPARMTMFGVTNPEQALSEAIFQINLNKHILRSIEFDTGLDAIACTVGDQILVQHEMPSWGQGGRTAMGSTASVIKLDREVTIENGNTHKLLVSFDSVRRAAGFVSGVSSNIVWLDGYTGQTDVKRVIINGNDYPIERVVNDGFGGFGVELEDTSAILTSQLYEIFDTDVIEERHVVNAVGSHDSITVDAAFSSAPQFAVKWMFGEVDSVKRPFRVVSISGSHEYERSIKAIEYVEEVYDLSNTEIIPTIEPTVGIGQVEDLTQENTWAKWGGAYQPIANISWNIPTTGFYGGALIYMARANGDFVRVSEVGAQTTSYAHSGLSVGDEVTFKVVAQDIIWQKATYDTAPEIAFTALARPQTGTPTNLAVTTQSGSYVLSWNSPSESFRSIEIWRSTTNDVATATKIESIVAEGYTDPSAPLGVQVYYWIRTINSDGLLGEWSAAGGTTAPIPGSVSNLVVTSSFVGTEVAIQWDGLPEAKDYIVEVYANSILSRAVAVVGEQFSYSYADAVNDSNINRAITFTVKPRLLNNTVGAGVSVVATNPQIASPVANVVLGTTGNSITVNFDSKLDSDLSGYKIYASETSGFTPSALNIVQDGRNPGATIPVGVGETWYVVVGAYDVWGVDGMLFTGEVSLEATSTAEIVAQLSNAISRTELAADLESELDVIGSQWSVKVAQTTGDGTNYIAGIGLSVEEGESGEISSNFLVKADNFAILASGSNVAADAASPFIVSGGNVFIGSAFIEDASITNAKIGNIIQSNNYTPATGWKINKDGSAEFSNITIRDSEGNILLSSGAGVVGVGEVNAEDVVGLGAIALIDQITSANVSTYIAAAAIGEVHVVDGAITNAKIGNVIQSNSYVSDTAGWKIDKNGNMELNSAVFRGTIDVKSGTSGERLEVKNNVIKVYDAAGILRVKMGDLTA